MLYVIFKYILGPFIRLFWRPIVFNQRNLRVKGKAIFVANHLSMGDPILIALVSPRIVHFMAKKQLFTSKIGNFFFRSMFVFPVNRRTADMTSLKNALKLLEKGKVFGIFPEGKRTVTGELDKFEKGAAFLAIRSGAPVIPMYIRPDSYKRLHPVMIVGKPIEISNIVANSKKTTLIDVVTDEISDSIDSLRVELEDMFCR